MTTLGGPRTSLRNTVARAVSEVFAPLVLTVVLLLLVGSVSTPNPRVGLGWGLLAAVFVRLIPYAFLLLGIRRGRWTDRHVRLRRHRPVPLLFAVASAAIGTAVLVAAGAPRQLVALVAGLAVTIAITMAWKISIHTAVASATATILVLVFGPALLLAWPLVPLVAWSRTELGDHTLAQVIGGAAIGGLIAATVFAGLQ
jgi:membrane-associated phospholipid phosphatase